MDRASEEGLIFTTLHRKKDGSDLPVEVSSVSMVVEDELVLVSIIRDISERKRAEETPDAPCVDCHKLGRCHLREDS